MDQIFGSSTSSLLLLIALPCCYFLSLLTSIQADFNDAVIILIDQDTASLQYMATLHQRTPSIFTSMTVDLGGRLTWSHCSPAYKSSTYGAAGCGLAPCASFGPDQTCGDCHSGPNPSPGCNNNTCSVVARNPITGRTEKGEVASDILTLLSTDGANLGPNMMVHADFVCATKSLLNGLAKGVKGVVGFGNSGTDLLSQLYGELSDEVFNFPCKFAICLSHSNVGTGFAIFGKDRYVLPRVFPNIGGLDVSKILKFTPFVKNLPSNIFSEYYINVTAIKINGKNVNINNSILSVNSKGKGGTKISTVHPYTVLESSIFNSITAAFTKALSGVRRVNPIKPFGACYEAKGIGSTRVGPAVPNIDLVMHVQSVYWRIFGANSMVQVTKDVLCLGFVDGGVNPEASIVIGGYQLEDNLVEFDQINKRVGFSSSLLFRQTRCDNFNFTYAQP